MTPRLTAEFWVQAYLTRLRLNDIPAFVTSKGDATAGAVIVKLNTLDGNSKAFTRSWDASGKRVWTVLREGADPDVDASLARQRSFDPDIWIIEIEDRQGRTLLDEPGLSDQISPMEWRDEGILLSTRRHGETSVIIEVLTKVHGRHSGVVRGGASRKMTPILQPGAILSLDWSARLEEHLGNYRVDPMPARTAQIMANRAALATLSSVTALVSVSLAEREPHPWLYARTLELLNVLGSSADWPQLYAAWELALLAELGFGLDLTKCAGTGSTSDLIWVSPKSGRAVSREAGAPWSDKLLELPVFLRDGWENGDTTEPTDLAAGFRLTGWFLDKWLAPTLTQERLPSARARAVESIQRGLNPQPA